MRSSNEIALFQTEDGQVVLSVNVENENVWLNRNEMATLFDRDIKTIGKHIKNALFEELNGDSVVAKFATTAADGKVYQTEHYNLDVIISVGYRVKSKRGVEFRRWANDVLKRYILKGYAVNDTRIRQLGEVLRLVKRVAQDSDALMMLDAVEKYARALSLLDDYDHQRLKKPEGTAGTYVLTYDECKRLIAQMKFNKESTVFGNEKDESFKSSIGAIYQSFEGRDVYPTIEEKAANLLYFITKNHSFTDGNKRIAAAVFLYFLDKCGLLFKDGLKQLDDHTLVAVTIMIAESKPEEKETMIHLVMNVLV
jgi:prophage maintenance system killer protein